MTADCAKTIVFLAGEHIYLRPLEPGDADRSQRWVNDPEVRVPLGQYLPLNAKGEHEFIETAGANNERIGFAIVLKEGDRHIGNLGLHQIRWKDRSAIFGILIGEPDCRGRGFGTEATRLLLKYAFETLNLNRIELGVYRFNQAAIRAYTKAGFVQEGIRREYAFIDGRYVDDLVCAALARDYFARKTAGGADPPGP